MQQTNAEPNKGAGARPVKFLELPPSRQADGTSTVDVTGAVMGPVPVFVIHCFRHLMLRLR